MRTRLEVFQRLDSHFRGNDKQGGNDEGDAFPWSPYPKLGLCKPQEKGMAGEIPWEDGGANPLVQAVGGDQALLPLW